ncbi:MAG: redoxin domain-containing protein [Verrucomicrobiae bacterium]|nr:redoxin domain-containing protein [Verrucomicrobiae bacterium]
MKNKLPVFAGFALFAAATALLSPATARTWTNAQGKSIEAELVSLKGESGSETAVLKTANGQTFDVPLASLSAEDQAYAKEQAAATPAKAEESAGEPSVFKKLLDGKLVAVDGKRVDKYEMASEPEYYAFYFSASWCGPCKEFTPSLVSFYNENPGAKKAFEVILVSRDSSEEAMEDYMKEDKMPWPGIKFRNIERMDEVNRYAGNGIPCLVLVDRQGNVVSDSYVNGDYRGPTAVMREMEALAAKKNKVTEAVP